jgi:Na+/proline symporter
MTGTIVLAFIVLGLPEVGGIAGLKAKLPEASFQFFPIIGSEMGVGTTLALSLTAFLAYIGIQWWASWYPGAEPGGGGYVAQRMMSAKDEKHSLLATLWFTIAHYCLRPWPWILTGLATLVLYPTLGDADKKLGYVYAMRDFLPTGLLGLLVAAFLAAYMSTIATHLNWGTSYIINDFYKRFVKKNSDERHYVAVSRVATLLIMGVSLLVTANMETISGAWAFIIEAGAGLGLVLILRWYWWRVNAWSEIAAMIAPFVAYGYVKFGSTIQFPNSLFIIVGFTTIVWLIVTFLTKPTKRETLQGFFERVHPGGWWKPVAAEMPHIQQDGGLSKLVLDWLVGVALVYSMLFGIGTLILGEFLSSLVYFVVAVLAGSVLYAHLSKTGWEKVAE